MVLVGKLAVERFTLTEDSAKKTESEMRKIRGQKMAMIFQEPMTSLNPVFTIGEQLRNHLHILNLGKSK